MSGMKLWFDVTASGVKTGKANCLNKTALPIFLPHSGGKSPVKHLPQSVCTKMFKARPVLSSCAFTNVPELFFKCDILVLVGTIPSVAYVASPMRIRPRLFDC